MPLRDQTVLTLMLKVKIYLVKIHVYSSEMISTYYGDIVLPIHFPVFGPVPPNHFANRLNANVQSCYCCCFSASSERAYQSHCMYISPVVSYLCYCNAKHVHLGRHRVLISKERKVVQIKGICNSMFSTFMLVFTVCIDVYFSRTHNTST